MQRLIVGLPYRGMVQDCLKKVKYKSSWEVIDFLFDLGKWEKWDGIVVPVPMFKPKERERGFNQAELIALHLGKPVQLLERVRTTKPMFGLTKKERQENVEGAFRLIINNQIPIIKQQRIILVDDVWTTGATMRECAMMLKQAGVRDVWGVTLAK